MAAKVQWGVMGNATIARKCVIGAIGKSHNGSLIRAAVFFGVGVLTRNSLCSPLSLDTLIQRGPKKL